MNIYKEITLEIIEALEQGVAPWIQPWKASPHRNYCTNHVYRGINILLLNLACIKRGFSTPLWITLKEINFLGGKLKEDEKGTQIVFWKMIETERCKHLKEEDHCIKHDRTCESRCDDFDPVCIPIIRYFTLFNIEQCTGIKIKKSKTKQEETNDEHDSLLDLATIEYGSNTAYYNIIKDVIYLPNRDQFESSDHFYATAFHELIHWTGHSKRLAREFGNYGDENYAIEELTAEIGAAFLEAKHGINWQKLRHPNYINNWLEVLSNDKTYKTIFLASRKAQQACEWLISERERLKKVA